MNDAASRGHPLHLARTNGPRIPHAVAMLHPSLKYISHRFDAPVGMPGKAGEVVVGVNGMKIVEKQEGVVVGGLVVAKRTVQMHACTLDGGHTFTYVPDFANCHCLCPERIGGKRTHVLRGHPFSFFAISATWAP